MKKRFWNKPSIYYAVVAGILSLCGGVIFVGGVLFIGLGALFFDRVPPSPYELLVLGVTGLGATVLLLYFDRYANIVYPTAVQSR